MQGSTAERNSGPRPIALVTGSSRGIGRAIALRLARDGYRVVVHCHRDRAAAEAVLRECDGARLVQANLDSAEGVERLRAAVADLELDVLVNNAGIWQGTPLGATDWEAMDRLLTVNLKAVFALTQALLPRLCDGARIINMSSVAARIGTAGGRSLYGASKAAVESLTRNWALELAPRRILVNAVAPGYVQTDMTAEHFRDAATRERALARHPLGRLGVAEEVADVVGFLCSNDARFITGQVLNVSGGFVL